MANEMDIMRVDLESVLPSATIMVVTVTGSTTDGKELSDADLDLTLEACERLLKLDDDKTKLFKFVEKNMEKTAPNLSQVLGTDVAARVMGLAGGLELLSKMPSNVVPKHRKREEEKYRRFVFTSASEIRRRKRRLHFSMRFDSKENAPPLGVKSSAINCR